MTPAARSPAAAPGLDLGILIASRDSATVGGAVATNAGGLRVLRYGPMRAQLRGIEAVLSDGTVLSHLAGLVKDNTGYDYPSLLAGSEGTLAVITAARLRLVPRPARPGHRDRRAGRPGRGCTRWPGRRAAAVPGLLSAEFFTQAGPGPAGRARRAWRRRWPARPGVPAAGGGRPGRAGRPGRRGRRTARPRWRESAADRARLWAYRERHPEAAGFLGVPLKLDVSVPAARWVELAAGVAGVVAGGRPGRHGDHLRPRRGRERARQHRARGRGRTGGTRTRCSRSWRRLGGSISAEHGIGALKARWLPLARSAAERALFARIRSAFDPAGILNPHVLPR